MIFRFAAFAVFTTVLNACAHTPEEPSTAVKPPNPHCVAPPPVHDIWALAPLLKKQGKIDDSMTREQQEAIIREDLRQTNERFLKCKK
jgi:hypothetical protein